MIPSFDKQLHIVPEFLQPHQITIYIKLEPIGPFLLAKYGFIINNTNNVIINQLFYDIQAMVMKFHFLFEPLHIAFNKCFHHIA
jgi:hypothetical protein